MRIQRPKANPISDPNLLFVSLASSAKMSPLPLFILGATQINRTWICSCLEGKAHGLSMGLQRLCRTPEEREPGPWRVGTNPGLASSLPAPLNPSQRGLEEVAAVVLWRRQAEVHLALLGFSQHPPPTTLNTHTHPPYTTHTQSRGPGRG